MRDWFCWMEEVQRVLPVPHTEKEARDFTRRMG